MMMTLSGIGRGRMPAVGTFVGLGFDRGLDRHASSGHRYRCRRGQMPGQSPGNENLAKGASER